MSNVGVVAECWRYPVKSMQGFKLDELSLTATGVSGDRSWGLLDEAGKLMSAKRYSKLLDASATDTTVTLADGTLISLDSADASAALSEWLEQPVTLTRAGETADVAYEMTFDPPNDDAELFDIPTPGGTFLDLAGLHLVATSTLDGVAEQRSDLDWSVRRFRPNLVIQTDGEPFSEQGWCGRELQVGDALLRATTPTVRCAMPLRAQPGGIDRQPKMFSAMNELNVEFPNHLGIYLDVVEPGLIRVGDAVELR